MPCYAVYATRWCHNTYVAFPVTLVDNWSEFDILCLRWPQFVISRHNSSCCLIMNHFCPLSRLRGTLTEIWSNMTEGPKSAQKCLCRDKYGPNLSYLVTVTNTGPLYATLELIWPNLSQTAVHSITWYTRPRSLNSALKWTNSFKLDILDHSWPPLPTTSNTGPVDAILCSICH